MIAPGMASANLMVKQLVYLAGACAAGVVTGLKVPVILNSRADPVSARVAACAVAALYARHLRERQ
jgi:phosphate acetyltransferase